MFEVRYVPTKLQKANIFTKELLATFCFLRNHLSLEEPRLSLRGNVREQAEADMEAF